MSLAGHLVYGVRAGWNRWHDGRKWAALIAQYGLRPGEGGLIIREGIGDHMLACAFAPAIRRTHGFDVGVVAGNSRYAFLGSLFPPLRYASWPFSHFDYERVQTLAPGHFFLAHFPCDLPRAIGRGDFHFLDAYRCRLGLPPEEFPAPARLPDSSELANARSYLESHGLPPARTVVVCSDARSIPTTGIDTNFWLGLVTQLRARGLSPVLNAGPSTPPLPGVPSLPIPLADFRAVALVAGAVCSIRSGLSDLVCDLPCRRAVIYPDVIYFGGPLHRGTTFARYGLPNPPFEIVIQPDAIPRALRQVADALAA